MLTVRNGPAVGLVAQAALLVVLAAFVGLSGAGWGVALTCGVVINAAAAGGRAKTGADVFGPADVVTLSRAMLACGVAALTAEALLGRPAVGTLVALATVALVLDAVDGWVARRTRTASAFGARFDGEVDAFLILTLSVYVAHVVGGWVLAIGAARYAFAVAGWALPWLRRRLPPRYWRKVVTAVQGIALTVTAADVVPRAWAVAGLLVALTLLAESFGRDVWWLWRHRSAEDRRRDGVVALAVTNALAFLLVWFALLAPNQAGRLTPGAFLRLPVEGLVLAGLALVLPSVARRTMAVVVGGFLGLLAVLKILDMVFFTALDRPFNPVTDRGYLGPGLDFVSDAFGPVVATLAVVTAVVLVVGVLAGVPLALGRLIRLVADRPGRSARTLAACGAVWAACALSGLQVAGDEPFASSSASRLAVGKVRATVVDAGDLQRFAAAAAADDYRGATDLLAGLRGKDVLVVFVESYGRGVLDGSRSSPEVRAVLDAGTRRLHRSGYSSRSALLTSPTFGGLSWLAHSTLQSGLWIDNQLRYARLLEGNRMTLSRAFSREGWRTVAFMPANKDAWPEGKAFYGFDRVYGRTDVGYRGPRFGWSAMPDQYVLSALQRLELEERGRPPVMAAVDLTSSHSPWAPLPRMVDWSAVGDGSVFERIHDEALSAEELWRHPGDVRAAHAHSIAYCLEALISFVETHGDDDLVLVILGDHQPAPVVSGHGGGHDVPVTLVSSDRTVIERISGWGWQDGMRPDSQAPVWRMDAFRDRFLAAYSAPPRQASSRPAPPPQP